MKELYNCPNCGAAITGAKCEYCGTLFKQEESEPEYDEVTFYADGVAYFTQRTTKKRFGCSFAEATEAFKKLSEL